MSAHNRASDVAKVSIVSLFLLMSWFTPTAIAPSALAEEQAAPSGKLVKVVMLSRHGVRSPIPSDLATWTASPWPTWHCGDPNHPTICGSGQLTLQGRLLAEHMGMYYRTSLAELLPIDRCPDVSEIFFWADAMERTEDTGLALLRGFRSPPCDTKKYFHKAPTPPDRIFHPVTADGSCKLDAALAESEIKTRAGGSLSNVVQALGLELKIAQNTLQCCRSLCQTAWINTCKLPPPPPPTCTLTSLPNCLVREPENKSTQVHLGGGLRTASTFAEILLLEYANGFRQNDVGWGRIGDEQMAAVFRLHTAAFGLEQRTPYIAKLQGSMLLSKMLLALNDETDDKPGSAPPGTKFVAYVGHDTNIANIAGILSLAWLQAGYQRNQTPPAGALIFELRETDDRARNVYAYYVAQSLDDMHNGTGTTAMRTPVPIPACPIGSPCTLDQFTNLVRPMLDPSCSR
jgi:4-phytase / acid phosphatase